MNQTFKTVIRPSKGWQNLNLKELWDYRDLITLFVKRDFTALYKQTVLGPAWAIIQPLFTTVVFTIVFGGLAQLTTADAAGEFLLPGFLFYMAGNICWSYFSSTLSATSNTFITNARTMGKVYYPRLVAPISTALSHLISFGIQFVLLLLLLLFFLVRGGTSIAVTPALLLIIPTVLQMILLSTGCGIIVSSLTTKYRDLAHAVGFCIQLWQYASPIAYGLSLVPEKYLWLYMLNPVAPIVTTFRYALFGFGYFHLTYYLIGWGITLAAFFVGAMLFSRIEKTFIDTI